MQKIQAYEICRKLLDEHGLVKWKIGWQNVHRVLASTYYHEKTIRFSEWYIEVNDAEEIAETSLHEITHALVGHWADHGRIWQAKAREIGVRYPYEVRLSSTFNACLLRKE